MTPPSISIACAEPPGFTQCDRRQLHHHALDQRVAGAAEGLDAAMHHQAADRLADLDADGAIRMRGHALELGQIDGAGVDIEAARAAPEGLDRRQHLQCVDDVEVDEADAARAVRAQLLFGGPAVHEAPVVEHHVVDTIGHDRAAVAHLVDVRVEDRKDTAGDLIGRTFGNAAVAVDRAGLEQRHHQAPAAEAGTADEDAATAHRRAFAARRQADQLCADDDAFVRLHVPQRERALQHIDAEAVRTLGARAGVGGDDVQAIDIDVTALDRVARQDLNLSRRGDPGQLYPAQARGRRVVEDRAPVGRGSEAQRADLVVGAELHAVAAIGKRNRASIALATQHLTRSKADGRRVLQRAAHNDPATIQIVRGGDKFGGRGN